MLASKLSSSPCDEALSPACRLIGARPGPNSRERAPAAFPTSRKPFEPLARCAFRTPPLRPMRRPNEGTSDDPTRETIRDEYQDARTPIVSFFATRLSALRRSPAGMVTPRLDAAGERSKGFLAYVTRRGARSDVGRLGAPIKCAGRGRSPRQFFQRARAGSAAVTGWHLCAEALTQRARGSKGFLDVGNAAGARS